jgi:hypothetical protein
LISTFSLCSCDFFPLSHASLFMKTGVRIKMTVATFVLMNPCSHRKENNNEPSLLSPLSSPVFTNKVANCCIYIIYVLHLLDLYIPPGFNLQSRAFQ